ncbi:acireductone synthase [Aminithiophilus ramosus]|uniref:Acireductone synthase n=2 Tax=Synergistales TaxID=649776 RepID=A0A9Q7ADA6_9BACT|nr:acireductone synthase [Aminithiophilus ramosus]QTX31354.1 acireductone synthase [Aminithiophilus ramosus]QVL35153.1 acireductone synthase [Synergistota bacterium]
MEGNRVVPTGCRAILMDLEGTLLPVTYVRESLFPYARERMASFVAQRGDREEVWPLLKEARRLLGNPRMAEPDLVQGLRRWIDEDRKYAPLKLIQTLIWEEGYFSGELRAPFYGDVRSCLQRWRESGLTLYIFSACAVRAQKLHLAFSSDGDLCALISGHFDVRFGSKKEPLSYAKIAQATGYHVGDFLFLSDDGEELEAASAAGFSVLLVARDGERGPGVIVDLC